MGSPEVGLCFEGENRCQGRVPQGRAFKSTLERLQGEHEVWEVGMGHGLVFRAEGTASAES